MFGAGGPELKLAFLLVTVRRWGVRVTKAVKRGFLMRTCVEALAVRRGS